MVQDTDDPARHTKRTDRHLHPPLNVGSITTKGKGDAPFAPHCGLMKSATFTITLAVDRIERPSGAMIENHPAPLVEDEEQAELTTLRVLAAEDNNVNQLVLRTLLAQVGIDPVIVANGEEAVEAWRNGEWDVILMDMQMPVMDGVEATKSIRAEEAASGRFPTPIIALTANAMAHQVESYRASGLDGHVAKPVEAAKLFDMIEQVITCSRDNIAEPVGDAVAAA